MEVEIDPNFEPQSRLRSNTWPARPIELFDEEGNKTPNSTVSENDKHDELAEGQAPVHEDAAQVPSIENDVSGSTQKKGGARRNAWGNLSYADLITKAINSSQDKRLTLSQIYDWMVQNVPYFRDKGDSNSSAGWKNSIRHNLSLHTRFVRVQNEGTGKSSWWIVNPEAKNSKAPRRRVASMDTKAMKDKRFRAKRKVDQLRALQQGQQFSGSTSDLGSGYSLSPGGGDYRQRTSSNASSLGRLSPTSYIEGLDTHNRSPGTWNDLADYTTPATFPDTIAESFAELLVNSQGLAGDEFSGLTMVSPNAVQPQQISPNHGYDPQSLSFLQQLGSYDSGGTMQVSPNHFPSGYTSQQVQGLNPEQRQQQLMHLQHMQQQRMQPSRTRHVPHTLSELLEQPDNPDDDQPLVKTEIQSNQPPQINLPRYNPLSQATTFQVKSEPVDVPDQEQPTGNNGPSSPKEKASIFQTLTAEQRNMLTTSLLRQVLTDQLHLQQELQLGLNKNSKVPNTSSGNAGLDATQQQAVVPDVGNSSSSYFGSASLTPEQVNGHGIGNMGMSLGGNQTLAQMPQVKMESTPDVPDDLQGLDFSSLPDLKTECDEFEQFLNQDFSLADPMDFNFDSMQAAQSQGNDSDTNKYMGFL